MRLGAREAAKLFGVSERTVERWLRDDGMPHETVHGQPRFQRAELIEWANRHGIRVIDEASASPMTRASLPGVADALERGGVHLDVPADDREGALRAVVERMPIVDPADRELVFEVLLAREHAGTTGVGDGIAIPHVRNPTLLDVDAPTITLCRLRAPVDLHAIDGKPVHTLFAIVAPTARAHLVLLARLAATLHDPALRAALAAPESAEALLDAVRAAEARRPARAVDGDATDDATNDARRT
jgi:PTS system nitrogen regulatory IIA component